MIGIINKITWADGQYVGLSNWLGNIAHLLFESDDIEDKVFYIIYYKNDIWTTILQFIFANCEPLCDALRFDDMNYVYAL